MRHRAVGQKIFLSHLLKKGSITVLRVVEDRAQFVLIGFSTYIGLELSLHDRGRLLRYTCHRTILVNLATELACFFRGHFRNRTSPRRRHSHHYLGLREK